ncbi:MAG TPA: SPW repeat protein [Candidatus Nanopelagicales bacterium]|nr:SPW repeat protein [Candidatus Nanopelagicales bacterium]
MTAARGINVALGVWLFISAFLWPHSYAQFTNAWVLGVLCVAFAVIGMWAPPARYLNTALGVWLFISAWALPTISSGTVWNHVIVSIAIFAVSLLPTTTRTRTSPTNAPRT